MIYVGSRHYVYLYCTARFHIFIDFFFLHPKRPFPVELLPVRLLDHGRKINKYRRSASYLKAGPTGGNLKFKVAATWTATLNFHSFYYRVLLYLCLYWMLDPSGDLLMDLFFCSPLWSAGSLLACYKGHSVLFSRGKRLDLRHFALALSVSIQVCKQPKWMGTGQSDGIDKLSHCFDPGSC